MNQIGIMQGRLSPPVEGRLQAFPWMSWEDEFHHARVCGFDTIEWLFEADGYKQNPIWTEAGLKKIRRQIATTGVQVHSLCASYFISHPFFRVSEKERMRNVAVLSNLIVRAASMGVLVILLPVLEASEVQTEAQKTQLLESLSEPLALAAENRIRLGLETELPAPEYSDLIEQANHPALRVYYDVGNATAKGFDIAADIRRLSPFLCGVHIKDRRLNGPNVPLGQGNANFSQFFHAISKARYTGPVVLETAVGNDPVAVAEAHLKFVRERLALAEGKTPLVGPGMHNTSGIAEIHR
jgi:L-ribulose-5-phosphate 3-epimerase